jgi:hypothetical protein
MAPSFRAVLSSKLLKERLNLLGKIGCAVCLLGSTVIVIHSPKEEEVASMEDLAQKMKDAGLSSLSLSLFQSTSEFAFFTRISDCNTLFEHFDRVAVSTAFPLTQSLS